MHVDIHSRQYESIYSETDRVTVPHGDVLVVRLHLVGDDSHGERVTVFVPQEDVEEAIAVADKIAADLRQLRDDVKAEDQA